MDSVYADIMDELNSRETYKHEIYAPYYIASYGTHCFNLMNQREKIYWDGKRLPNMRMHVLFVAPPGFMKSHYLGIMGGDDYSIFRNTGVDIGAEQSMTEAGFIGTIVNINGIGTPTEGAAMTFKQGMLMIDEFSAITNALKVQYNSQLDTQLLAALDHGRVFKRLGGGKIEYTTNLTLWAGVQPARYDMTSGLGRRLCYLLFLPTRQDNDLLMETMHRTRNIAPVDSDMLKLRERISKWKESMNIIKRVEFSDSVLNKYKELGLFSYESSYFDRILLGWHLAVYGADTTMYIDVKDNEIDTIIKREKKWRDTIGKGVDYAQLMKLITMFGGQISQAELVEEAIMIGWNAQQVYEMVAEMNRYKLIGISGDIISIKSSKHYQL